MTKLILIIIALLSLGAARAQAGVDPDVLAGRLKRDPTAQAMQQLLTRGLGEAQADIDSDTVQACAAVEKADAVFRPLMKEYEARCGDDSFWLRLKSWFETYCHREPESPPPDSDD
jgi:hypothetical protein